jgi:hypothetical protein
MNTRKWTTLLRALDPRTDELKRWAGPNVPGLTFEDAQSWCDTHGMGYLTVTGELVAEISEDGTVTDHEVIRDN